jgi:hypothetical protein
MSGPCQEHSVATIGPLVLLRALFPMGFVVTWRHRNDLGQCAMHFGQIAEVPLTITGGCAKGTSRRQCADLVVGGFLINPQDPSRHGRFEILRSGPGTDALRRKRAPPIAMLARRVGMQYDWSPTVLL